MNQRDEDRGPGLAIIHLACSSPFLPRVSLLTWWPNHRPVAHEEHRVSQHILKGGRSASYCARPPNTPFTAVHFSSGATGGIPIAAVQQGPPEAARSQAHPPHPRGED